MKMSQQEFEEFTKITNEKMVWLKTVAETCLEHKKYLEKKPKEKWDPDDHGLSELDVAILYMYGLLLKHGIVQDTSVSGANTLQ